MECHSEVESIVSASLFTDWIEFQIKIFKWMWHGHLRYFVYGLLGALIIHLFWNGDILRFCHWLCLDSQTWHYSRLLLLSPGQAYNSKWLDRQFLIFTASRVRISTIRSRSKLKWPVTSIALWSNQHKWRNTLFVYLGQKQSNFDSIRNLETNIFYCCESTSVLQLYLQALYIICKFSMLIAERSLHTGKLLKLLILSTFPI